MKKSKKRVAALLLQVAAVVMIITILGYFVYYFVTICADEKQQADYGGQVYASTDQQVILDFSESADSATLRTAGVNGYKTTFALDFEDNIFTAINGDTVYYFLVINDNTLYFSEGNYLYVAHYATT
jgi:hypothetical protein